MTLLCSRITKTSLFQIRAFYLLSKINRILVIIPALISVVSIKRFIADKFPRIKKT